MGKIDPLDPATGKLFFHIFVKGYQAGSIVGLALVAPIAVYRARLRGVSTFAPIVMRALENSAAVGATAAGVLGAAKVWGDPTVDQEGIHDRAYRLQYNESQKRCDRISGATALASAAASSAALGLSATNFFGGAALGAAAGVAAHVLTSQSTGEKNKMVKEIAS